MVFHLDKWNIELIGYSVHITDFSALPSKGPTAYIHLEMISKVLIILFLFCLWG